MRHGNLFVISGPAGVGKGTLVSRLIASVPDTWVSVSATTRQPRSGEADGVQYFFKTPEEFESMVSKGELLEWARYTDNCYGTPRLTVERAITSGKQVILEIDVQGAAQVKRALPAAYLVFIAPPSMEVLEARLRGRNTETEEEIQKRLCAARVELSNELEYDLVIVNDDLYSASKALIDFVSEKATD